MEGQARKVAEGERGRLERSGAERVWGGKGSGEGAGEREDVRDERERQGPSGRMARPGSYISRPGVWRRKLPRSKTVSGTADFPAESLGGNAPQVNSWRPLGSAPWVPI